MIMKTLTLPNGDEISYLDELTALWVYNEIFVDNEYLKHGINVKEGDFVFDVGANIGIFSRFIAKQAPNLKIFAFEPIEPIFTVLKANVRGLPCFIKTFNIGLAEKAKTIEFFYYPNVSADSTAVPFDLDLKVDLYVKNYKEAVCKDKPIARIVPKFLRKRVVKSALKKTYRSEKVICQLKPLSDIIKENNVDQIDLLKIDAENYERQVLAGISDEHWKIIKQISIEVHEHIKGGENLLNEVIQLLENKHFEVHVGEENVSTKLGVFMVYAKKIDLFNNNNF
ncbi:MAG: FkbM family methyltransferase [Promethearchaeota archaeon]|nr:MAG: FkbM family methyltransferase [Candidatus Lokiarchaeota archaeon]